MENSSQTQNIITRRKWNGMAVGQVISKTTASLFIKESPSAPLS
jgi:hypothetical protein